MNLINNLSPGKRMKRSIWTAAIVAFFTTASAYGQTNTAQVKIAASPSQVQRTTYLYATKNGQKLQLDRLVEHSAKMAGKRPVIIFSFGGGWEGGARNDEGFTTGLEHFTSLGYDVVALDYRLGIKIAKERNEITPANGTEMYLRAIQWSVEDLFDATSFVLKHADDWNIDKDQIVLMGGSSGATNSLVAEYNVANATELARTHLPVGFKYAGVISMAGAFWLKANTPLAFKNQPAPIMFFHGGKDQLVTYDEVEGPFSGYGPVAYFRKFPGPDYPKWFVDYPQGDHIIAAMPMIDSLNEMDAFLEKLVKERQQVSIHAVEEDRMPKTFANAAALLPKP
ncbi:alpha/beta hydrolase [Paraburkholderia dipogonis]